MFLISRAKINIWIVDLVIKEKNRKLVPVAGKKVAQRDQVYYLSLLIHNLEK